KSNTRKKINQLHRGRQDLRKLIHIAIGMFGFVYVFFEWEIIVFIWLIAIFCAWFLPSRVEALEVLLTRDENRLGYSPEMIKYGGVMALSLVIFQGKILESLIVLAALAFGDGFSGLIGLNFKGTSLPYNSEKSVAGTFAFIIFGTIGALALIFFYAVFKIQVPFEPGLGSLPIFRILIIMAVCAVVESIPWKVSDNLPIGIAAIIMSFLTIPITH
ncbi:hypothetical protein KKB99_07950, partial [bacterium]|nr:hypothetical protein [bacterium]MBU1025924.1 hypothetical protein [bacterium]